METSFSPTDLILPTAEDAWVERRPDDALVLRWRHPAESVTVYVGDDPDMRTGGHLLAARRGMEDGLVVTAADIAKATGRPLTDDLPRPYFLLDLDGQRHIVAERALPLSSGVNFRDAGGYRTAGGRMVRWGQIYRAGSLADLSDEDVAYLGRLDLSLSCDLRSIEEVDSHPDRLPPQTTALHRPVVAEVNRLRRIVTLLRLRHRVQELLQNVYTVMIDQNGPNFAGIVRLAADPANLPLVIHCTAGKDRTGLAVALLLLALGVPEETVIADYTLSNHAFDVLAGRMKPEMERLYAFGFGEMQLRPFLLAEARTMTATLEHLRRRYGSVEWYLLRSGLDEGTLEQLRETLLVD